MSYRGTGSAQVLLLFLTLCAAALPVFAALGDTVDSVSSDARKLQGRIRTTQLNGYSMHQISREDGTVVTEYVSPSGKVFGVSWQGPVMPNLSQILGSYYTRFESSVRSRAHRRSAVALRSGDLVVESGGHLRDFHGRAYVTSLLPNDVSEAVVQ
jgi:hypothetical protein